MADKVIVSREKLVAVADAVREKTGGTDALTLDEMPKAIAGIEGGGGGCRRIFAVCKISSQA